MKLLVDAQWPPALARFFAAHGCAASHIENVAMRFAEDDDIAEFAARNGFAVVSKDEDFHLRWLAGSRDPQVIWLRCGNIRNRALFTKLPPLLPDIFHRLTSGETLIQVVFH